LCLDDIYWTEVRGFVQVMILRRPTKKNGKDEQLASDMKSIWNNLMGPYFDVGDGILPTYFSRLNTDLTNVFNNFVHFYWFFDYKI
ncbi:hypothetical protein Q6247_25850, partial [Klebsiella pneumoniae]